MEELLSIILTLIILNFIWIGVIAIFVWSIYDWTKKADRIKAAESEAKTAPHTWKELDNVIAQNARKELKTWSDLAAANPVFNNPGLLRSYVGVPKKSEQPVDPPPIGIPASKDRTDSTPREQGKGIAY